VSALTDRIRAAQQAGVGRLTNAQIVEALERPSKEHGDHKWHQVGPCVWCGPCGVRLYQGTMPKDHPVWCEPIQQRRATDADKMRERWGKV